jgi:hypothetical protein
MRRSRNGPTALAWGRERRYQGQDSHSRVECCLREGRAVHEAVGVELLTIHGVDLTVPMTEAPSKLVVGSN